MALSKLNHKSFVDTVEGNPSLIINGDMAVAQRGTSFTNQTGSGYFIDRFRITQTDDATWTYSQETDAPSGFTNSFKALVTTADGTNDATDYQHLRYSFEGQDLQQIAKGTADAKQLTLSFWVKCSSTGTFPVEFRDTGNSRHICSTYTIDAADTWEYKTITVDGDTSGTLANDNTEAFRINWWYGAGSNFTSGTTASAWQATNNANIAPALTVNLPTTLNAYFQITGVKLEVGLATPYQHESYAENLRKCQRYYYRIQEGNTYQRFGTGQNSDTSRCRMTPIFPVEMRATPSLDHTGTAANYGVYEAGSVKTCTSVPTLSSTQSTSNIAEIIFLTNSLTVGRAAALIANNNTSVYLAYNAEL